MYVELLESKIEEIENMLEDATGKQKEELKKELQKKLVELHIATCEFCER